MLAHILIFTSVITNQIIKNSPITRNFEIAKDEFTNINYESAKDEFTNINS